MAPLPLDGPDALEEMRRLGRAGDVRLGDQSVTRRPIMGSELTTSRHKTGCFACMFINSQSLRNNQKFLLMMKMYTQNSSSCSRDSLYVNLEKFYNTHVRPDVPGKIQWTVECIKEHFTEHTRYPTDEILTQLDTMRGILRILNDTVASERQADRTRMIDERNVKMLVSIQREIQNLLKSKREISTMIGYCEVLNY